MSPCVRDILLRTYTNEGELVLDNTMGSGTTCVAAALERRQYIGMESDKDYYDISVNRVNEVANAVRITDFLC